MVRPRPWPAKTSVSPRSSSSSARNVPIGEERGETDVFAGYPALVPLVVAWVITHGLEASVWPRIDRLQKRLWWLLDWSALPETRGVVQETIVAHYPILYVITVQLFFLTLLFTVTFCILSTATPYPQEKSVKIRRYTFYCSVDCEQSLLFLCKVTARET